MHHKHCCKALLFLLLWAAPLVAQPTYELRVGRVIKAFDEYTLRSTYVSSQSTRVYIDNVERGAEDQNLQVSIVAKCSVVSVTTDGQEKEKRLIIRDFRRITPTDTTDVLPTGTKVRCWFSDSGAVFTVDDQPAHDTISSLLSMVVKGEGGARTGALLDPKKPVRVGQTWKMNVSEFRRILGKETSALIKKVAGTCTFERIDTVNSLPVCVVTAKAEAPNFTMYFDGYPSQASLTTTFQLVLPVDNRFPPEQLFSESAQRIVTKRENVRMVLEVRSSRSTTFVR